MKVSDVGKIAVLRANALGDLVFALPALDALRARFPAAEVTLLGRPLHQAFFSRRPAPVDRVEILPVVSRLIDGPPARREEIEAFVQRMRDEHFDIAVQLHGGGRFSNPLVGALGARVTAGLRTRDAAPLDIEVPYFYYQHEVHRYLEVVGRLGAKPLSLQPRLRATPEDVAEAVLLLGLDGDERHLVVLHPGAGDLRRRWSPAKFAATGDVLARAGGRVVLIGKDDERHLCRQIATRMGEDALDLSGGSNLSALIGLLARASLVVCNDSGPLHLATALGSPAIGIYWCGNMINAGAPFRSRFRPCISWQIHCPVCGIDCTMDRCTHQASFVDRVTVDEVLEQAFDLWDACKRGVAEVTSTEHAQ